MCVFCKIANHQIPSLTIFENERLLAFLDINPTTKGHTLVIPKQHYDSFLDIPIDELSDLIVDVQALSQLVIEKTNARGMNLITNVNEVAGQTVQHAHFHIIPRYSDSDGVNTSFDVDHTINVQEVFDLFHTSQ